PFAGIGYEGVPDRVRHSAAHGKEQQGAGLFGPFRYGDADRCAIWTGLLLGVREGELLERATLGDRLGYPLNHLLALVRRHRADRATDTLGCAAAQAQLGLHLCPAVSRKGYVYLIAAAILLRSIHRNGL